MVKVEGREKGYDGPRGSFTPEKSGPVLYTAKNRTGNSRLIGFNVGLNARNKWSCNFCVDLALDDKGGCRIESIRKDICAK